MDTSHLRTDELNYELFIRFIDGLTDKSSKQHAIRVAKQKEDRALEVHPSTNRGLDSAEEISICYDKLVELKSVTNPALQSGDQEMLKYARSRFVHARDRLNRISATTLQQQTEIDNLQGAVKKWLEAVDQRITGRLIRVNSQGSVLSKQNYGLLNDYSVGSGEAKSPEIENEEENGAVGGAKPNERSAKTIETQTGRELETNGLDLFKDRTSFGGQSERRSAYLPSIHIRTKQGDNMTIPPKSVNEFETLAKKLQNLDPFESKRSDYKGLPMPKKPLEMVRERLNDRWEARNIPPAHFYNQGGRENRHDFDNARRYPNEFGRRESGETDGSLSRARLNRKYKPVHSWSIKFDGDTGISLTDFIDQVEMLAIAERIDEAELLSSIVHLLKGRAFEWYRSNYRDFRTWQEFKAQIREEFIPENYDHMLLWEIETRVQGKDEPFGSYFNAMKRLFGCLRYPLTEDYKLYVVRKGLYSTYALSLASADIRTLVELSRLCKRIDSTRMMLDRQRCINISRDSLLEPDISFPNNKNQGSSRDRRYVNAFEEEVEVEKVVEINEVKSDSRPKQKTPTQTDSKIVCWNCDRPGHNFNDCTRPRRGSFCYKCGERNVIIRDCKRCNAKKKEQGQHAKEINDLENQGNTEMSQSKNGD